MTDERGEEVLADATSVLLLTPTVNDAAASASATLLEKSREQFDRVVAVTVGQSATSWQESWDRQAMSSMHVSCIDVDAEMRSAAKADGEQKLSPIERVTDPSNLELLGRTISDVLEQVADNGERVGLTIRSVSDLLHHADEPTVFKFVYTLGEVVRRVDGTVYFHLDAAAHDAETVDTFAAACDAIVELDDRVTVTENACW